MYMTVPVIVINILHCCLYCSRCVLEDIITVTTMKRFIAAQLKCILYEINNIYTIYINRLKYFEITYTLPDRTKSSLSLCLVKDLNPYRQDVGLSET